MPNESESNMEPIVSSLQADETGTGSFSASLAGSKKQQEESSLSPTSRLQTPATKGSPSLVYVRRKLETVHGKINASSAGDTPDLPKMGSEAREKDEVQWEELEVSKMAQREAADPAQSNVELQREVSINYWTERYNRLQEYLKYLDQSGLKDYAKKYQTFSIEDLNKHAVNLEKRAIRLSLEEALQSQIVRDLNLLGKSSQQ
ncbi:hypothetical protein HPP92_025703 [Vanilla planifolia]|uniref:Uncharacterized protein n=1 Tax=Vanilla planifolia TaxID=51239 RepID=A0A835PIJ0_VANPL|nr:hypothetical protein HPP92_025977 [Vanilla planifolia]KAG0454399.1 hypothetical protein HPP92_025703 [Vanilla planifolia]